MKSPLFSLILAFAIISTAKAEQIFKSTTTVQIHPSMIAIPQVKNPDNPKPGALISPVEMENELRTILAPATLKIAAQSLNLKTNQEALKNLKSTITTSPIRGTNFIKITSTGSSKSDAIRTVKAVTSAYIKRRNDDETAKANRALAALEKEIAAQSEQVTQHRKTLTTLIEKLGIPSLKDLDPDIPIATPNEALAAIRNAKPEKRFATAAAVNFPDNPVTPVYQNYLSALEKIDNYNQVYREKHPKLVKANQELTQVRTKLKRMVEDLPLFIQNHELMSLAATPKDFAAALDKFDPEERLSIAAKLDILENPVTPAYETYRTRLAEFNELSETYLPKHPKMVRATQKLNLARSHVHLLAKQLPDIIQKRRSNLFKSPKGLIKESLHLRQYNEAKKVYEQSREVKIAQQKTRVLLKAPRKPVTIQKRAR